MVFKLAGLDFAFPTQVNDSKGGSESGHEDVRIRLQRGFYPTPGQLSTYELPAAFTRCTQARACAATFSAVNPYFSKTIFPGAEAPKRSTLTTTP